MGKKPLKLWRLQIGQSNLRWARAFPSNYVAFSAQSEKKTDEINKKCVAFFLKKVQSMTGQTTRIVVI